MNAAILTKVVLTYMLLSWLLGIGLAVAFTERSNDRVFSGVVSALVVPPTVLAAVWLIILCAIWVKA